MPKSPRPATPRRSPSATPEDTAQPEAPNFAPFDRPTIQIVRGVVVVGGYGVRIRVDRRHLVIEDGIGSLRRTARFAKAPARLRRVVVLGHTGFVTLDALRWLADVRASFVMLDADGIVFAATGPRLFDDARLRRAQAAASERARLDVTRYLLAHKIAGTARVVERFEIGDATVSQLMELTRRIVEDASSVNDCLQAEAEAAVIYWRAWSPVVLRFVRKHEARIPDHWRTFGTRASLLTGQPRRATNPANAVLNYLYAILEAEARIALRAVGLDPGMGVFHVDVPARDSFANDVMEAVRPDVDAYALELFARRTLRADDFTETREGGCRLLPALAHELGATGPHWAKALAPIVEQVATLFVQGTEHVLTLPTPLSQRARSAGRAPYRRAARRSAAPIATDPRCRTCGVGVPRGRAMCESCVRENQARFGIEGSAALKLRHAAGTQHNNGKAARRKSSATQMQHAVERRAWVDDGTLDAVDFVRDVLPGLIVLSLASIAHAIGVSNGYAGQKRVIPHKRHWTRLLALRDTSNGAERCDQASS